MKDKLSSEWEYILKRRPQESTHCGQVWGFGSRRLLSRASRGGRVHGVDGGKTATPSGRVGVGVGVERRGETTSGRHDGTDRGPTEVLDLRRRSLSVNRDSLFTLPSISGFFHPE